MTPASPSIDLPGHDWQEQVDRLVEVHFDGPHRDVLGLLLAVNEAFGFVPRNVLVQISTRTGFPVARMFGIVSFYRAFRLQPPGAHIVHVCQGTACHVAGSPEVMAYLEQALGIDAGRTTSDGRVTLSSVACVGCCSLAPVVRVDGATRGRARAGDVRALVDEIGIDRAREGRE